MAFDKNKLQLSNQTNSGYKFVITFFDGPNEGKFVAYSELTSDTMREMGRGYGNRFPGITDSRIVGLGLYDDIRDAAYIAQKFNGEGTFDRNSNLQHLFDARKDVLVNPPEWKHDPDYERMEAARVRAEGTASNRAGKLNIQGAIGKFYADHGSDYKITVKEAPAIREAMIEYIEALGRPTSNADLLKAAEEAFQPYRKA